MFFNVAFRWLDRASISDGNAGNWHLCSVSQVEGMKIVLRMLPVFFSSMIGYISLPLLLTLTIQQGVTMNTKLGAIHVPPASLFLIPVAFQLVILVLYDRLMVPFARKITGCPTGITHLQRAGVGFVANIIATVIGAVIKKKRKGVAEEYRLLDSGKPVPMHVMWLGLQFFAVGIVDISTFVGLLEFFNNEVSKGMKSLGTAIFWCNIGMSSFMGTVLVNVVNKATRNRGIGWLEGNNLNRNYLDRFYWLLAILGSVTFINYLYWARRYFSNLAILAVQPNKVAIEVQERLLVLHCYEPPPLRKFQLCLSEFYFVDTFSLSIHLLNRLTLTI
ncbi:protein NRT1/ PTR FAMILY 4.6-like [Papaver somniferum]|uniref:protein NRT1/ PTR FAMILY 4.6-like n=1 Tax=Papaver somniferum TaxID=3469 RepID=UPI000E6FE5B7|nr:protein NRT1/ PTR FAMILY 4.6-like [Papaver somniferum]